MFHTIKQLEEKNSSQELDVLLWSNRMDLVALSNVKGEVALHRLTWNRVWLLSPIVEGYKVNGLAWRPDGKVLAIAYNSGDILLINVENKSTLYQVKLEGNVSCVSWISEKSNTTNITNCVNTRNDDDNDNKLEHNIDQSAKYLPDLPLNSSSFDTNSNDDATKSNLFLNQDDLNILVIGTAEGLIYLSIFGCIPASIINVNTHLGEQCEIVKVHLSTDLKKMFAIVRRDNRIEIVSFVIDLFKTYKRELIAIASKFQELNTFLYYLSISISTIKESWESILLEMDSKLSKYASKVPNGILSADFLDLLVFGVCTDEMQEFLLQDLTKKGLEKFGQTIEMSYANIQKLLLKNITKIGPNITYHLSELLGMARLEYKYGKIGLDESKILTAISSNGTFLSKAGEMQQIINDSMINYKAFFRWLYMAIMHLMDERVAPEILKMTQQDLVCITDFLQQFDSITTKNYVDGDKQTGFVMERLGQYLSDNDLTMPLRSDKSEWNCFLMDNKCIRGHPFIINHNKDNSLVQQYNVLVKSVKDIFEKPTILISEAFKLNNVFKCLELNAVMDVPITCVNYNDQTTFVAFLCDKPPCDAVYIVELNYTGEISRRACLVYFQQESSDLLLLQDVQFYSENILTILLQEPSTKTSIIYQFTIGVVHGHMTEIEDGRYLNEQEEVCRVNGLFGNVTMKHVEGIICSKIAVSGTRKVSVILSENRRKVRLFEMEGEEDEDDDGDITNSTLKETDTSSIQEQ